MPQQLYLIHGMCAGPWCWEPYRSHFEAAGHVCHTPALPYHDGPVDAPPDPRLGATSLLDYAAWLEQDIQKLGVLPVLIGHSMGGLLALMLAGRGLARGAVLLAPAWPAGTFFLPPWSTFKAFLTWQRTWGFWRKPVRFSFDMAVRFGLNQLPVAQQRSIHARLGYESGRAASEIGYWFLYTRPPSAVAAVTCPVLMIGGGQDRLITATTVRRIAGRYPQATYKEYTQHGHWLIGEPGWQVIANDVLNWMQGNVE